MNIGCKIPPQKKKTHKKTPNKPSTLNTDKTKYNSRVLQAPCDSKRTVWLSEIQLNFQKNSNLTLSTIPLFNFFQHHQHVKVLSLLRCPTNKVDERYFLRSQGDVKWERKEEHFHRHQPEEGEGPPVSSMHLSSRDGTSPRASPILLLQKQC